MTEVYLVTGNCGDYYCGCGGGHVLGVADSLDNANRLAIAAISKRRVINGGIQDGLELETFGDISVSGPLWFGLLNEGAFLV